MPQPTVTVLAEAEWNLSAGLGDIPEWQWLTMLNYEYARCSKPIIQGVKRLRSAKTQAQSSFTNPPQFARYLARIFPEFPKASWAQITENKRAERLGWFGITKETKFYMPDPAWQAWELFESEALTLPEKLTDKAAESYGVFKIDLHQEDQVIAGQFCTWLKQRRGNAKPGAKTKPNSNEHCGRGNKKRKCEDYLKVLGGLRALKYWGSAVEAETMTQNLYTEERSWNRAENQAGEMFARLAAAWPFLAYPFDPFEKQDHHNIISVHLSRQPLSKSDTISKARLAKVKKIVSQDFSVAELKTEKI